MGQLKGPGPFPELIGADEFQSSAGSQGQRLEGGIALARTDATARLPLTDAAGHIDVDGLCARAAKALAARSDRRLLCDAGALRDVDLGAVEALARVALTVRRRGGRMRLIGASVELLDLLAFCGLPRELGLETERDAEHREEALRVEEEGDPGDPPA